MGSFLRQSRRHLPIIAIIGLAGLFLYGWFIEAHWVERVHRTVAVDAAAPTPALKIVHLSDLHIQTFGRRERRALELVREAGPDLVCLTGDYLRSGSPPSAVAEARRFMRELGAPHGVFATLGNWDRDPQSIFDGSGVELLAERSVEITVRGATVRVAGCGFGISPKVLGTAPPDTLSILLYHHPDFLEQVSYLGYDLVLAGHTHGGQVRLPGLGPIVRMSRSGYDAGLYTRGKTVLYVNRGLGAEGGPLPEFRLFCRPEVTVLDVKGID
jgi:predicted MPP superfamily phosphohydrolase